MTLFVSILWRETKGALLVYLRVIVYLSLYPCRALLARFSKTFGPNSSHMIAWVSSNPLACERPTTSYTYVPTSTRNTNLGSVKYWRGVPRSIEISCISRRLSRRALGNFVLVSTYRKLASSPKGERMTLVCNELAL